MEEKALLNDFGGKKFAVPGNTAASKIDTCIHNGIILLLTTLIIV